MYANIRAYQIIQESDNMTIGLMGTGLVLQTGVECVHINQEKSTLQIGFNELVPVWQC